MSWATLVVFLVVSDAASGVRREIGVDGEHRLDLTTSNHRAEVVVDLVRVARETPGALPVELFDGLEAVSLVRRLKIAVDGHEVFVPRSAFADLVNPHSAVLTLRTRGAWSLSMTGADGGDGYEVLLEFDATQVRRRRLRSLMVEEPSQDTHYKLIVLQDAPRTGGRPATPAP